MIMNDDFNDIEFKKAFQEQAHKPGENAWFTRRVLNRLPEKESTGVLTAEMWGYVIGIFLSIVGWGVLYKTGFFDVITVKSLIYIIALAIGSFILLVQTIRASLTL